MIYEKGYWFFFIIINNARLKKKPKESLSLAQVFYTNSLQSIDSLKVDVLLLEIKCRWPNKAQKEKETTWKYKIKQQNYKKYINYLFENPFNVQR